VKQHMFEMLMTYMRAAFKREEGQALVEYALILSLVSIVAVGALTLIGTNVTTVLNNVATSL
jgi:pilus assembly protein Flp/PilA